MDRRKVRTSSYASSCPVQEIARTVVGSDAAGRRQQSAGPQADCADAERGLGGGVAGALRGSGSASWQGAGVRGVAGVSLPASSFACKSGQRGHRAKAHAAPERAYREAISAGSHDNPGPERAGIGRALYYPENPWWPSRRRRTGCRQEGVRHQRRARDRTLCRRWRRAPRRRANSVRDRAYEARAVGGAAVGRRAPRQFVARAGAARRAVQSRTSREEGTQIGRVRGGGAVLLHGHGRDLPAWRPARSMGDLTWKRSMATAEAGSATCRLQPASASCGPRQAPAAGLLGAAEGTTRDRRAAGFAGQARWRLRGAAWSNEV